MAPGTIRPRCIANGLFLVNALTAEHLHISDIGVASIFHFTRRKNQATMVAQNLASSKTLLSGQG